MNPQWNWARMLLVIASFSLLCAATSTAQMEWSKHIVWSGLNEPEGVIPVDIDFDGDIDFVGSLRGPNSLVLFINDGFMNWSMEYVTQSLDGAYDLRVVDLDFDGDYDIVAAGVDGNHLYWYENDGALTWTAHNILQNRDDPRVASILDYDYDGDLDLLIGICHESVILIMENDGGQNFTIYETIQCPGDLLPYVYWVDMDNDCDYDILYNLPDENMFVYLENIGNQQWNTIVLSDQYDGSWGLGYADVDSDGDTDVLGAFTYSGGGLVLWENDLNGNFIESIAVDGLPCDDVMAGDVDHDGDIDILPYQYTYNPVDLSWVENKGTTWQHHILEYDWHLISDINPNDFDGDGDLDILVAEELGDRFTWLENLIVHDMTPPYFSQNIVSAATNATHRLNWGDLDRDGDYDILAAGADGLIWWEQQLMAFTEQSIDPDFSDATSVCSQDLDRDGDFDLVATSDPGRVSWLEQTGPGTFLAHNLDNTFPNAEYALVEDFNKDGKLDVAAAGAEGVSVYFNDGLMNFTDTPIPGGFTLGTSLATADIDRDGDPDIVASGGPNSVVWFDNHRDGTFTENTVSTSFTNARSVHVVDLDRDGDFDILGAGDPGIYWWEKDGGGFIEHVLDGEFTNATSVATEDILWDGKPDVVACGGNQIAFWVNNGDGTFERHNVEQDFTDASCVLPVDLDRNGTIDFIGTSAGLNTVAYWLAEGAVTISIEPFADPVVIPPWGGSFDFETRIVNRGGENMWLSGWTEAQLPNGNTVGPLIFYAMVRIGAFGGNIVVLSQNVPGFAPAGDYVYSVRIGDFPDAAIASDAFLFTKSNGVAGTELVDDWALAGGNAEITESESILPPTEYVMETAYPNPFNAKTMVRILLPERTYLKVEVVNVKGQLVTTLVDGVKAAGEHAFEFNASHLASGLYFVRATVPGEFDQTRKVMLVR